MPPPQPRGIQWAPSVCPHGVPGAHTIIQKTPITLRRVAFGHLMPCDGWLDMVDQEQGTAIKTQRSRHKDLEKKNLRLWASTRPGRTGNPSSCGLSLLCRSKKETIIVGSDLGGLINAMTERDQNENKNQNEEFGATLLADGTALGSTWLRVRGAVWGMMGSDHPNIIGNLFSLSRDWRG